MTLKLIVYPKYLQKTSKEITAFDDHLAQTIKQLHEAFHQLSAHVLTGPQVGLPLRILITHTSEKQGELICMLNPKILSQEGNETAEEYCASFPGLSLTLNRAHTIQVEYQDQNGALQTFTAQKNVARYLQHGIEQLNGMLFIDHLSKLKRSRLLEKLEKVKGDLVCDSHDCNHEHH